MRILERESALTKMNTALQDAQAGNGRFLLISGESGIGKTTLVEQFLHNQPQRVLWGACDALFTPRPFGPLYDMAGHLQGELPSLLAETLNRSAIFAACLHECQTSTIFVFEDIHWADEATLDLLKFLGRRMQQTRSLLIATYRDDELNSPHPLRLLLGDLVRYPGVERLNLTPLSLTAVRQLAQDYAGDPAELHRQTGGNPFFVSQVLASDEPGIPATVRDVVLARAARLSSAGREVLNAAAVIGQRIEPWLLDIASQAETTAVDECLALGILLAQGECFAFRHELARQTILDSILPHQRTAYHQTVLQALITSAHGPRDFAQLAHHAQAAGDRTAVLKYAPAAARQSSLAGAHREAAALYALALTYIMDQPADERAYMLEAYARECDLVGQQAEGIAARRRAADLWRELNNPLKQGENLAYLMSMLTRIGQNAEAAQVSQASIKILEDLPPGPELAMAYRVQAHQCLVNRDVTQALPWANKSLVLAEQFNDAEVLAAVYITVGTTQLFFDYESGCAYLEEKIAFAQNAGLDVRVAHIYSNLGSGSGELFHLNRAEEYLKTGIAYAAERDLDSHRLYMLAWQALMQMQQGYWQEAVQTASAVLQNLGASVIARITALIALGRVQSRRGDPDAADTLDKALELATTTATIQRLGPVRAARAEAAWLAGDSLQTLQEANAVYDLAESKQHPWFTGELAYWRWQAGETVKPQDWLAEPYARQLSGDWRGAAAAWEALGCPYEQARALTHGDGEAQKQALVLFEQLGARPMIERLRQRLQDAGVTSLPRGPRLTTQENPFQLTNRQMEVWHLLAEELTNAEIAARLHISPKTVDHHVSAVLSKLHVSSREEAATLARQHLTN